MKFLTETGLTRVITNIKAGFAPKSHNQASDTINALTGYERPSSTSAITVNDTLNQALGKLEAGLNHVTAASVYWGDITGKPTEFKPEAHNQASNTINALTGYSKPSTTSALSTSDSLNAALGKLEAGLGLHTHNYAGSSSAGGAATSANKINTDAGSQTQPVYFNNGVPVATKYALNKTVPADALFTDTTYENATTSVAGLMSADDKTKLNGIAANANNYTHPNTVTAGTVGTSSATSGVTLAVPYVTYNANGHITATGTHTHTVSGMTGASADAAGATGLVPAPAKGDQTKFLRADGTWQAANNYSHPSDGSNTGSFGPSANASPAHGAGFSVPYITVNAAGHVIAASTKTITLPAQYSHPTSGVTAASYGPSANASPAHGGTFSVPYVTVDANGHITAASTKTITLPADNNTDTQVTNTLGTTTKFYVTGTTSATTNTGTQYFDTGVYVSATAGELVATKFTGALNGKANDSDKLGGTAASSYALKSYVDTAVANIVNSAPETLDTLSELSAALGDDPNFATTIATQIGGKVATGSADYIKSASVSGKTLTLTKGNNTTVTFTETDTTYSAGSGLSLSGTTFNHASSVTAGTAGTSAATSGSTLAVPYVTYNATGHITATGTHTHTISGFLPSAGGTVTGNLTFSGTANNISYTGSKANYTMIRFKDNASDTYGNGISIGGGGAVIVGGGESATAAEALLTNGGDERLILTNDQAVDIYAGAQNGIDSAKHYTFGTDGVLTCPGGVSGLTKAQVTTALGYTPPTTDTNTLNTAGSTNSTAKLFLIGAASQAANPVTYSSSKVYETDGALVATSFAGSGASLTTLNASNISSGTLAAARLATSGVTAGSYGPTANVTGSNNATINVPQITVDAYGRVTAVTNRVYTSVNTDNNTLNTAGSTDTSSKIFLIGATSQAANPQTYSDNEIYATSGVLTTKSVQVGGTACTLQYNATNQCVDFVFAA